MIWGQVCESDKIYSTRTKRWYEVTTVLTTPTEARIVLRDVPITLVRPLTGEIPDGEHRRGATGQAMDLIVVAFSGQKQE